MTRTRFEPAVLDFAGLLGLLGFTDDEFVSLFYEDADGSQHTSVLDTAEAVAAAARIPRTANAFFGVTVNSVVH